MRGLSTAADALADLDLRFEDLVEEYLPDGLHPSGDGYEQLGENFSRIVLGETALREAVR